MFESNWRGCSIPLAVSDPNEPIRFPDGTVPGAASFGIDPVCLLSKKRYNGASGTGVSPKSFRRKQALKAIDFSSPKTLDDALQVLSEADGRVGMLAGGTDIIVQVREAGRDLDVLMDIKKIPELNELSYDEEKGLLLGAAVPCTLVYEHREVAARYPGLVDAASLVGGTAIQNRATFGGNICNASPAADTVPALIVHHAICQIAGPGARREVPVEEFCTAPGKTVLESGELLVSFRIPPPEQHFGAHYLRFIPRNEMDIAVVGSGASVVLDDGGNSIRSGRVALGAVAPTPLLVSEASSLLAGSPVSRQIVEQVEEVCREAARPINDIRGTVDHRKHLSGVLARRALEKAIQRAQGETAQ